MAERKQREGAVYRADAIRDSHDRVSKEAKALKKSLAKEVKKLRAKTESSSSRNEDGVPLAEYRKLGAGYMQERRQRESLEKANGKLAQELKECQARLEESETARKALDHQLSETTRLRGAASTAVSTTASPYTKNMEESASPVTSVSLQQQFNELTEAIMRIPVRQRSTPASPRSPASPPVH